MYLCIPLSIQNKIYGKSATHKKLYMQKSRYYTNKDNTSIGDETSVPFIATKRAC